MKLFPFILKLLFVIILVSLCFLIGKRLYTHVRNAQIEIANLYEAMVITPAQEMDSLPHHVFCIGNSITSMQPSEAIGWKGRWGMAASRAEKDYVHLLEKKLKCYNAQSTVTCMNIVSWEIDPTVNIKALLQDSLKGKDMVIIRIGDNVRDVDAFRQGLQQLVVLCKLYTSKIIITGCFWKRIHTESVLISTARANHLKYVPLFWIGEIYGDTTYCHDDDSFYDEEGMPYQSDHPSFKLHPNDRGMKMIADAIFDSFL